MSDLKKEFPGLDLSADFEQATPSCGPEGEQLQKAEWFGLSWIDRLSLYNIQTKGRWRWFGGVNIPFACRPFKGSGEVF